LVAPTEDKLSDLDTGLKTAEKTTKESNLLHEELLLDFTDVINDFQNKI